MVLRQFLDTNKIEIKESLTVFCEQGLNLMRASKDLLHSIGHIERMLNDLNSFLADNPTTKKHINFNILIPAICWHDSWKTTRNSKWALKIILEHIIEGKKSAKMFSKTIKGSDLEEKIIREIVYCIKKHSIIQIKKRRTAEAKLLNDLDRLEFFSHIRSENGIGALLESKTLKYLLKKSRRLAKSRLVTNKYYFKWFEIQHELRFPKFIEVLEKILWSEKVRANVG